MLNFVSIACGGAIGASLRYGVVLIALRWASGFWGIMAVNILGSALMGALYALSLHHPLLARLSPFLLTGVLGGFTTFSAFSLDVWKLVESERMLAALAYVIASVIFSIGALFLSITLTKEALQ